MADFIKIYGTLILATIALIQPWVWSLWKRYFREGKIEIYETGNLEIGYSAFGPTIGMNGTLRCINRDLFVQTIELELVKQKDSSKHVFGWGVFRSEKLTISGERQATFELPYGFMLSTSSPQRFNIQFHDMQVQSEMRQVINKVSEEWARVATERRKDISDFLSQKAHPLPSEFQDPFLALYEDFAKSDIHVQSYTTLDRMCYWEVGKYTVKIIVRTSKPDRVFEKNWDFTLTEQEVRLIRLNVIKLLQDVCGRPSYGPYFFAYPKYELK